jgi:hypothetical protein
MEPTTKSDMGEELAWEMELIGAGRLSTAI